MKDATPSPFQKKVLSVPEDINILLVGGRGGGKSVTIQFLILRHVQKYGALARPLLIRETYKALEELENELSILFKQVYGRGVKHNRQDHVFRLPNGAVVELGQLERAHDYEKYHGHSYTMLVIDEFGNLGSPKWVTLLKTTLRSGDGIPLQEVRAANPGGNLHSHLQQGYISQSPEGVPFQVGTEWWVWLHSTFRDNPHINHADYEDKLRAAANGDEDLAKSWIDGDWHSARGAMFGGVLHEKTHRFNIQPDSEEFSVFDYMRFIAMDWGTARPAVAYLCLRSRGEGYIPVGDRWMRTPPGSIILLDEVHTCAGIRDDPNKGLEWPPGKFAEAITEMCAKWKLPAVPTGIGDDAYGLDENLLRYLNRYGIYLNTPTKGKGSRVSGWSKMRDYLANAKLRNGKRGMWINSRCAYFWATVPWLPRDPDRPEDVKTDGPDHAADAARYAVVHNDNTVIQGFTIGHN